jgi:hypothetical protein
MEERLVIAITSGIYLLLMLMLLIILLLMRAGSQGLIKDRLMIAITPGIYLLLLLMLTRAGSQALTIMKIQRYAVALFFPRLSRLIIQRVNAFTSLGIMGMGVLNPIILRFPVSQTALTILETVPAGH